TAPATTNTYTLSLHDALPIYLLAFTRGSIRCVESCLNLMITTNNDRIRAHTARRVNEEIDGEAKRRVVRAAGASEAVLSRRIDELNQEWDMERWLETNASALAFTGTILGLLVNKKFFAVPCLVLPFLFQHAVQGWCPPVPFLR